jgi:hypothetical protein
LWYDKFFFLTSSIPYAAPAIASKNVTKKKVVLKKEAAGPVNHKFASASSQDALWESLCHKEFGVTSENVSNYNG